ncbi:hypothetical protein [Parafrankia sp. FMc2]|uniref:hypothetical protein n=1 Tax=Parafrankia sp. FMc2 TaxID=3233196 RepID=UPI0034D39F7F
MAAIGDHRAKQDAGLARQFAARPEAARAARAHRRGNAGSWLAVALIIVGFVLGALALPTHSIILWIMAGTALVAGGILALRFKIMEQTY